MVPKVLLTSMMCASSRKSADVFPAAELEDRVGECQDSWEVVYDHVDQKVQHEGPCSEQTRGGQLKPNQGLYC